MDRVKIAVPVGEVEQLGEGAFNNLDHKDKNQTAERKREIARKISAGMRLSMAKAFLASMRLYSRRAK